jgi:hypothetical protein
MTSFDEQKTPQQVGEQCARAFAENVRLLPEVLSSLVDSATTSFAPFIASVAGDLRDLVAFSIDDIDQELLFREALILLYIGNRLAIQQAIPDDSTMKEVCGFLDNAASEYFPTDLDDLLDKRGLQYFTILKSHRTEINADDWGAFNTQLGFTFKQFCLGGGGENDPIISSGFQSMIPLSFLATDCWIKAFIGTIQIVTDSGL